MTTAQEEIAALAPEIRKIADSLAIQWPGIDREDITQEMTLKVAENWATVSEHDDRHKIALGLAKKRGVQFCSEERYYYQAQTAEWIYTPREVRALLAEYYYDADAWLAPPTRPQGGRQTVEADGLWVALADIQTALEAVSESDQAAIVAAFDAGEKPTTGAEKMRLSRAIDRVTARLNRSVSDSFDRYAHDGPGSRTAMSNAQARFITGNNY